jgi:hypothetical protein
VYTARISKRINIVLPETTLNVLDRMAPKGNRSHFISQAEESLKLALEWFPIEEETWQESPAARKSKK